MFSRGNYRYIVGSASNINFIEVNIIDGEKEDVIEAVKNEGQWYKNNEAFHAENTICYVPSNSDKIYIREDLIEECRNKKWLAEYVFDIINWQHPSTLMSELEDDPEILGERYEEVFCHKTQYRNKPMKKDVWIKTDDMQYVKKINTYHYEVLEIVACCDQGYVLQHFDIDKMHNFDDETLKDIVDTFGYDVKNHQLKTKFGSEDEYFSLETSQMLIAEILAEMNRVPTKSEKDFDDIKEIDEYLKKNYNIENFMN